MDEKERASGHEPPANVADPETGWRWTGTPTGWPLFVLMLLLASRAVFLLDGAVGSLGDQGSGDLYGRFSEFQWVRAGQDPYPPLVRLRLDANRKTPPELRPFLPTHEEMSVGAFADGDFSDVNPALAHYPQWSYALLAPLLVVPWPATMWVLLGLDLLAFTLLFRWAHSLLDGWWGWLAVFVVLLPAHSWSANLSVGQFSVLIMGAQVLLLHSLATNRSGLATASLGWLAAKPTSSTLFGWTLLLPWLQKRASFRFVLRSVAGVVAVVLGATVAVWIWTDTAPWLWLAQVYVDNHGSIKSGYGLLPVVGRSDEWLGATSLGAAVAGLLLQGAAVWGLRNSSLLVHFAVAGFISRFWTYHRHYDDVLLLFLMLALVVECRRGSWLCVIALLAMASAYGTPTPSSPVMALWRLAITAIALLVVVVEHRRSVRSIAAAATPRSRVLDGLHQSAREAVA